MLALETFGSAPPKIAPPFCLGRCRGCDTGIRKGSVGLREPLVIHPAVPIVCILKRRTSQKLYTMAEPEKKQAEVPPKPTVDVASDPEEDDLSDLDGKSHAHASRISQYTTLLILCTRCAG